MDKSYKLFVGGLPVRVDKEVIVEFFTKYGTVLNCKLKKNQQTGRSLGFAYLNMKEKEAFDRLLNESVEFQGRVIEVKPVWKKKELGDKLEEEKRKKLFVSNLPMGITNEDLVDYFSQFGSIQNAFIIKDPETNQNKNYGYVIFKEVEDLEAVFANTEPHFLRPGFELKLERCLNSAEIALLKQTNSYRSSMKSSYFHSPNNTVYNRTSSPLRDNMCSPERTGHRPVRNSAIRSNASPAKLQMSSHFENNLQSKNTKRSAFSIPKKKKYYQFPESIPTNGAFQFPESIPTNGAFHFRQDNLYDCGNFQPFFREQIIRPQQVRGSFPVNLRGQSEDAQSASGSFKDSPRSSTKRSILALSERIDQREMNYRFSLHKEEPEVQDNLPDIFGE